ncbi:uncharacterized protein N7479_010591 [Penicillium vulpinum]|uniref:Uncharacterized protein n=1 Tax=Penicillium vulpinum TaxID=29845 RepID=A0A1V6S844_9EURO|nr:uncharacterized protein N7479_010591 [Penicillium vulpinum]KAJ5952178.1 hypothetical protein N7479_010591 [Penicillium vulpinum]OQE10225.1 hypothetical protein PENVUL_c004G08232 [Penicillium vulpinum]
MANPYRDLRLAIQNGDVETTIKLLDNGLTIKACHFLIATVKKHISILELFLSRGWDINADMNDMTPSALVYTFEDVGLLKWFLSHGANPNKRCRIRNCTPLSYAVRDGPFNAIKILLQNGGQVQDGQLLHYAAMRTEDDNHEVLQFIYNQDPDYNKLCVNKMLDEGTPEYFMNERTGLGTPLHYAARSGSAKMVTFLVEQGGAPDRQDPYRRTPIGYAVRNGHHDVEQILKDKVNVGIGLVQGI